MFGSKTEKIKALGEQLETEPQSGNQAVRDDALSTMKELSAMLGLGHAQYDNAESVD